MNRIENIIKVMIYYHIDVRRRGHLIQVIMCLMYVVLIVVIVEVYKYQK